MTSEADDEEELIFLCDCSHGDVVRLKDGAKPVRVLATRARWEGMYRGDPDFVVVVDARSVPHNIKADILVCRIQEFTYPCKR